MYFKNVILLQKFRHYFTQNDNLIVTCLIVTVLLPNHLTLSQGNIHILSFNLLDDSLFSCYHFNQPIPDLVLCLDECLIFIQLR